MIDRDHLARQTGQDLGLQREILILFIGQMQDLDQLLADCSPSWPMPEPDRFDLEQALHRYRGAAAAVGAAELAASLARAEQDLASAAAAHDGVRPLRDALAAAVGDARSLIDAPPPGGLAKNSEKL